jgi:hypothetical protein
MRATIDAAGTRTSGLARRVVGLHGVLGCIVIDRHGNVLARTQNGPDLPPEIEEVEGVIPAVVWGGALKAAPVAGDLQAVVAEFERMAILGLVMKGGRSALVVALSPTADLDRIRHEIMRILGSWPF